MSKLEREEAILEEMLSICGPQTLRDVRMMLSVAGYRLSAVETNEESAKDEISLLGRTLDRAIPLLEKLAGVTLRNWGLKAISGGTKAFKSCLKLQPKLNPSSGPRPRRNSPLVAGTMCL